MRTDSSSICPTPCAEPPSFTGTATPVPASFRGASHGPRACERGRQQGCCEDDVPRPEHVAPSSARPRSGLLSRCQSTNTHRSPLVSVHPSFHGTRQGRSSRSMRSASSRSWTTTTRSSTSKRLPTCAKTGPRRRARTGWRGTRSTCETVTSKLS